MSARARDQMNTYGIDFSRPNLARVYDVLAGGHDNLAADRDEAERLLAACPALRDMARENRAFTGKNCAMNTASVSTLLNTARRTG
jgi:S-adenosyl methyltransferase